MSNNWMSLEALEAMGVTLGGKNIRVSTRAVLHNPTRTFLGDHCRVDDMSILSGAGEIRIGRFTHIASMCHLTSGSLIDIGDFCNVSSGSKIFGSNDDYSGEVLVGACIPEEYKRVTATAVVMQRLSSVGANSVVLPGVTIHEGAVLGCLSMAKRDIAAWVVAAGCPARVVGQRSAKCVAKARELLPPDVM